MEQILTTKYDVQAWPVFILDGKVTNVESLKAKQSKPESMDDKLKRLTT